MDGRARRTAALAALGLVLVGAIVVVFFALGRDEPSAQSGDKTSTPAGPPALTVEEAKVFEDRLASADPAVVASVLSAAVAPAYTKSAEPLLPAGTTLSVDETRFTRTGPETASVPATLTGPRPGSCDLLVVREGDRWVVYSTTEVH